MELTREQKEDRLVQSGFLVPEKVKELPDAIVDYSCAALDERERAAALPAICPMGTEFTFSDHRVGEVTGYNGSNVIFTLREPETREMNIQQLRSLNLLKE